MTSTGSGIAAAPGEDVDEERQRGAGRARRREWIGQRPGVQREVGRGMTATPSAPARRHRRRGAAVSAVVCAPAWTSSRPRVAARKRARRAAAHRCSSRIPSPVVPQQNTPSAPCDSRKATIGPMASTSSAAPPSRSGRGGRDDQRGRGRTTRAATWRATPVSREATMRRRPTAREAARSSVYHRPAVTYVIIEPCIGVKDASCVDVCPVDCIHATDDDAMFFIDPDECIDCGACEPECPVTAIFAEDAVPETLTQLHPDQRRLLQASSRRCRSPDRPLRDARGPRRLRRPLPRGPHADRQALPGAARPAPTTRPAWPAEPSAFYLMAEMVFGSGGRPGRGAGLRAGVESGATCATSPAPASTMFIASDEADADERPDSPVARRPDHPRLRADPLRARRRCGVATVTIDRPEVMNAFDFPDPARARRCLRAGRVGRRGRGGGRHRRRRPAFCTGRRPRRAGGDGLDQRPVLALDGCLHRDARPAAEHRQADDRPHQRRVRRRRQRAPDGVRPGGHRRRRLHPPCRPGARVGAGRRRDAVAAADRRRPRAREIIMLCEPIPPAQALEWGLVSRVVPAPELDATVADLAANLARKLPEAMRYTKTQLNWWRDLVWSQTVDARPRLAGGPLHRRRDPRGGRRLPREATRRVRRPAPPRGGRRADVPRLRRGRQPATHEFCGVCGEHRTRGP